MECALQIKKKERCLADAVVPGMGRAVSEGVGMGAACCGEGSGAGEEVNDVGPQSV
jgi:hypothetical protein